MWAAKLTINDNIGQESCTECLKFGVTYACTYVCTGSCIHTTLCKITQSMLLFSLVSSLYSGMASCGNKAVYEPYVHSSEL